ncbi:hypothetical protein LSTR_LSTR007294 [Laodelphax striatellus]|uniref:Uncharacterized protein n=1 Tax=Laodelphax striatellus TaxID=195883 RepID=A0A482XEA9_LAOST|nr:hypothetical protein LSTR_LSTR007294 [Laodelphax striatellus]
MDSRMSTILSSTATVGDSNFCYTPNRDDIIEVRKKLKKVPEDCARYNLDFNIIDVNINGFRIRTPQYVDAFANQLPNQRQTRDNWSTNF